MVNALAVNTILLACRGLHVNRIVHVSCALVHGLRPDGEPADENTPFLAETPYAHSKAEGEMVAQAYSGQPDLRVTVLQPVTPLGARDCRTTEVLMTAYRQPGSISAAEGEPASSFVDARDVARAAALVAADDRAVNRTYIVRGFDATLAELVGALCSERDGDAAPPLSHAGRSRLKGWPRFRPRPQPGLSPAMADALTRPRTFDDSRIRGELGFQPEFDLRATAEAMAASYWEREIERLREPA
jgi:nucleoside-diphosphate-sugar epimerase